MPEPHLRAADADRAAVAEALGAHMSAGRLTVAEYDERLTRAYAARTYGELAELTTDLPAAEPRPYAAPAAQSTSQPGTGCGGPGRARPWAGWLSTAVVVIGIWALSCLASASWIYPWPVWVIGPWGLVLLTRFRGDGPGRNRDRRRAHRHG
jgi:hypothetical protein